MGAPNRRRRVEISDRRRLVADLYVRGHKQQEIADQLGVTQPIVSKDLAAIQAEWQRLRVADMDQLKRLELERIDRREREAWDAWERSKQPTVTEKLATAEDSVGSAAADGTQEKPGAAKLETTKRVERTTVSSAGNPRFLEIVEGCVQQRCKILGLFAAEKQTFELPPAVEDDGDLTPEQGRTEFDAVLVALRYRRREGATAAGNEGDGQGPPEADASGVSLPAPD